MASSKQLCLLGVSFRTAPAAVREAPWFQPEQAAALQRQAAALWGHAQTLGQVKKAAAVVLECGAMGGTLHQLLVQAIRAVHLCEATDLNAEELQLAQDLHRQCAAKYNLWKFDEARQRKHWSARYIDYFGARGFILRGSSFI